MKRVSVAATGFMSFAIALCSITVAALLYVTGPGFLESLELKAYDLRLQSRGPLAPAPRIVLCVVDEKSLRQEGRWPWPRWKLAKLVDKLSEQGAKVIAFDIGFFEPDRYLSQNILDTLEEQIRKHNLNKEDIVGLLEETKRRFNNDLLLANSIKKSKARVVLGYFFHMSPEKMNYRLDHEELLDQLSLIETSKYPIVIYREHASGSSPFTKAFAPVANLEGITFAASSTGYFNIFPDSDGVVRRIPLAIQCGGDVYAPLSVQALWNAMDRPPLAVVVSGYRVLGIKLGNNFIPTDENGNLLINFLGPPGTFPHIPISDILKGEVPPDLLKGSIVFVGATAVGIYDQRATPFSPVFPGLEVHATVADNILKKRYLIKPKWVQIADLGSICALALMGALFLWFMGPYKGAFVSGGLFTSYIITCSFLFWRQGIWLNIVYPAISLAMTYGLLTAYYYVTQEREKKRLKVAFHHYVSPIAVKEILKQHSKIQLGGHKRDMSVLFSDLRGFTQLSKTIPPQQLVTQLNEYLTTMTEIVFEYGGTLDKYIGDGLMALFGAPVAFVDHPGRSCSAALKMIKSLEELNAEWVSTGKTALDVGIGISTGEMLVGNLGSKQRFDYTAIGEAVNLGAKLQELSTRYGVRILISEQTRQRLSDDYHCFEVDTIKMSGGRIETLYGLMGELRSGTPAADAIKAFSLGLKYYKVRDWKQAGEMFFRAYRSDPSLRVADIYVRRCQYLLKNPPPENWDGVWGAR